VRSGPSRQRAELVFKRSQQPASRESAHERSRDERPPRTIADEIAAAAAPANAQVQPDDVRERFEKPVGMDCGSADSQIRREGHGWTGVAADRGRRGG